MPGKGEPWPERGASGPIAAEIQGNSLVRKGIGRQHSMLGGRSAARQAQPVAAGRGARPHILGRPGEPAWPGGVPAPGPGAPGVRGARGCAAIEREDRAAPA